MQDGTLGKTITEKMPVFDQRRAVTIADLRAMACKRLPDFVFGVMEAGNGGGAGPMRNVAAFDRHLFTARVLVDVEQTSRATTLLGRTYASPFGISAVGYASNFRRGADQSLAAAARDAGVPFMLSGGSGAAIEEIAAIAPGLAWQQLYAARDERITDHIIGRVEDAGVDVLVYTVDSPIPPRIDLMVRSGIRLPAHVPWRMWPHVAWQAITHPGWTLERVPRSRIPVIESWRAYAPPGAGLLGISQVFQQQVPNVKTWREAERIRKRWPGKLVLKGIVDPRDAQAALEIGADAITVSNHGGNKFEMMAAAIDYLPGVARAIAGRIPVLFDGGIRRGSDVLVALALGADFCFVGRATLYGVIAGGEAGARHALSILEQEIDRALAHIGCCDVAQMTSDYLHRGGSPGTGHAGLIRAGGFALAQCGDTAGRA